MSLKAEPKKRAHTHGTRERADSPAERIQDLP